MLEPWSEELLPGPAEMAKGVVKPDWRSKVDGEDSNGRKSGIGRTTAGPLSKTRILIFMEQALG